MIKISIIIPVYNEAETILSLLQHLEKQVLIHNHSAYYEIICVDGGSTDKTLERVQRWSQSDNNIDYPLIVFSLVSDKPGRARQMNKGAEQASGDILLFLHADTLLPASTLEEIQAAIQQGYQWGRFDVRLSGEHRAFRLIERMINWRSRASAIATGDQALFITRPCFQNLEGFPAQDLMEDVELCKRLKQRGLRPYCSRQFVVTSSRRWEVHGIARTVLLMWWLRWRYCMGAPASDLKKLYR